MASHKGLQRVGLTALCNHIKEIRALVEQTGSASVQISQELENLTEEVEGLINDVDAEVENLTNAIIAGNISSLSSNT